jgi:L-threonylcarbamoyladenylate synthase
VRINVSSSSQPQAPGQLHKHYAPDKRFFLGKADDLIKKHNLQNPGILSFKSTAALRENEFVLSHSGDLHEAARNLFGMLRQLDDLEIDAIIAEEVPDFSLGRAINDRLRRAAAMSL